MKTLRRNSSSRRFCSNVAPTLISFPDVLPNYYAHQLQLSGVENKLNFTRHQFVGLLDPATITSRFVGVFPSGDLTHDVKPRSRYPLAKDKVTIQSSYLGREHELFRDVNLWFQGCDKHQIAWLLPGLIAGFTLSMYWAKTFSFYRSPYHPGIESVVVYLLRKSVKRTGLFSCCGNGFSDTCGNGRCRMLWFSSDCMSSIPLAQLHFENRVWTY